MIYRTVLLSTALLLNSCHPYGFYAHSEVGEATMIEGQRSPFNLPDQGSSEEIIAYLKPFHPLKTKVSFQKLGHSSWVNIPFKAYPKNSKGLFRLKFDQSLIGDGVITIEIEDVENRSWSAFVGDHHEALETVFEDQSLPIETRIELVKQYNEAYPQNRRTELITQLESDLDDREFENAVKTTPVEKRYKEILSYLDRFPGGKHVLKADRFLTARQLRLEDEALAMVEDLLFGNEMYTALQDLAVNASGWNRLQIDEWMRTARLDVDHLRFATLKPMRDWALKTGLEAYVKDFPNGVHLNQVNTMLDRVNQKLDTPYFQTASSQSKIEYRIDFWNRYLDFFPNGRHREEAKSKIVNGERRIMENRFRAAMAKTLEARQQALLAFLALYPNGDLHGSATKALKEVNLKIETSNFQSAMKLKELTPRRYALSDYMRKYPEGRFYRDAREELMKMSEPIERAFFEASFSYESPILQRLSLQQYIDLYPKGFYRQEAVKHLQKLGLQTREKTNE